MSLKVALTKTKGWLPSYPVSSMILTYIENQKTMFVCIYQNIGKVCIYFRISIELANCQNHIYRTNFYSLFKNLLFNFC